MNLKSVRYKGSEIAALVRYVEFGDRRVADSYFYEAEAVDIAGEQLMQEIIALKKEIGRLKKRIADNSWVGDVDRQGGSFTPEEINRGESWQ